MNRLDIQIAVRAQELPERHQLQHWVDRSLSACHYTADSEIVVRIVETEESARLNRRYRNKQGATNILSFPFEAPDGVTLDLLGDLVICAPLVALESRMQHKPLLHHWAHIVVHGVLHLLGYDHLVDAEAEQMEALEIHILRQLNIANPYLEDETP